MSKEKDILDLVPQIITEYSPNEIREIIKASWNAALKKVKEEILNHDFKKGIDYNWLENIRKPICKIIEGLRK